MILRLIHGVGVAYGLHDSGGSLKSILTDLPRVIAHRPQYLVLYLGLTGSNLFIAWAALRRFGGRFLLGSIVSYLLWLTFFVWHGWFVDWAPFRLRMEHPVTAEEELALYENIWTGIVFYFGTYTLFPVLCYLDRTRHRFAENR